MINAVGSGRNGDSGVGGQTSGTFTGERARRRYRRNGTGSPTEAVNEIPKDDVNVGESSAFDQQDQHNKRQQHQKRGQRQQRNGHRSRRRRGGEDGDGREVTARGQYGGWVDAAVGGVGGGVPSTGGGIDVASPAVWWSTVRADADDGTENFAADDGYAGTAGAGAGHLAAALVRRGWESGDKELTPRAPVFAADGQGYVSVAPVREGAYGNTAADHGEGGVRLRRPSAQKQHMHNRDAPSQGAVGNYFAQLVAVNITKKLLVPLTLGELDDENDDGSGGEDKQKKNAAIKSWTVVRILAWDQRSDMM